MLKMLLSQTIMDKAKQYTALNSQYSVQDCRKTAKKMKQNFQQTQTQ